MTSNESGACKGWLIPGLLAVGGLVLGAPLVAQIERQHGAHVHGQANATLSQDGPRYTLELTIPGANLVGFEHPPRDEPEYTRIDETLEWFAEHPWLVLDDRGDCRVDGVSADATGYGRPGEDKPDGAHEHSSEPDHDHDRHDHDHHDHAEFRILARVECADPDRLRWMEVDLFRDFPGNEKVRIDSFTDRGQKQFRLTPDNRRIDLTR